MGGKSQSGNPKLPTQAAQGPKTGRQESPFDMWLKRKLQEMYSSVAREPIPDELLRLVEANKPKKQ